MFNGFFAWPSQIIGDIRSQIYLKFTILARAKEPRKEEEDGVTQLFNYLESGRHEREFTFPYT